MNKSGVLPRRVEWSVVTAESRSLPLSGFTDVDMSKIKVRMALDYFVGRVHVVVQGWPWVVFHSFGCAVKSVEIS